MPKGFTAPHPANKEAVPNNKDKFSLDKIEENLDYIIIGSGMSGL